MFTSSPFRRTAAAFTHPPLTNAGPSREQIESAAQRHTSAGDGASAPPAPHPTVWPAPGRGPHQGRGKPREQPLASRPSPPAGGEADGPPPVHLPGVPIMEGVSEDQQTAVAPEAQGAAPPDKGPVPEPIRFFGTTWVDHDRGYGLRRLGVSVGSLAAAAAGSFVLKIGFQGLDDAKIGTFVTALAFIGLAVCSVLAFRHTWRGFVARHPDGDADGTQSLYAIGFVGGLLAYFVRSLSEAPGEDLRRTEYAEARARYEARQSRPKAKAKAKPKGKRRR